MRLFSFRLGSALGSIVAVSLLVLACSSGGKDHGVDFEVDEASSPDRAVKGTTDTGGNNNMNTFDGGKPRPSEMEAGPGPGPGDAAPMSKPDASKPTGAGDAGKLVDASDIVDAKPPPTGSGDPLDPIDESLMPSYGFDEGVCTDFDLTSHTGRCYNGPFSGADYVEGCTGGETYLLDCARYDSAGSVRSICEDDPTNVGCYLIDQAKVASFEASQNASFLDQFHACPTSWEGYGYCQGDFISICSGGEDYWLDCTIYNSGPFTYTCGTDASGNLECQ